jgi:hypothetical protein
MLCIGLPDADFEMANYLCGFAAALATFHRLYGEPEKVRGVMEGGQISLDLLKGAGARPTDLTAIEKCFTQR